ncbi:MAG TPA: VOC family protein [Acidimicrobiales bacterium]|nr:VOC family protein [Acidimicrobiales bacterium]
MTTIRAIHHLSLSVTDLGPSTEWYRQTLGFEVVAEVEGDGFRRNRMRSPGGVILTLTAHDRNEGEAFDERRTGMDHVSLAVGGDDEVVEWKHRFERLGVEHSDIKRLRPGAAMITLRDPDNIQLEVFGLTPET